MFSLIQRAKQVARQGWKSLSAVVLHSLPPPRPAVWEGSWFVFRGGTGQGARQGPALTKSGSARFHLRAEGQGHFLLPPLARLGPRPPGQSFSLCHRAEHTRTEHFNTGLAQKWGWQPKELPCHEEQNQERWESGRKTNSTSCRGFRTSEVPFESEFLIW